MKDWEGEGKGEREGVGEGERQGKGREGRGHCLISTWINASSEVNCGRRRVSIGSVRKVDKVDKRDSDGHGGDDDQDAALRRSR